MGELIFMGITALAAIGMFFMTSSFPVSIIDKSGGPALFPRIVIILLILFMIIRAVIVMKDKELWNKQFVFTEIFKGSRLIYLLVTLAYILLIKQIGFVVMTAVYMYGLTQYLYYIQQDHMMTVKRNLITALGALFVTLGVYFLFSDVLNIRLPLGILKWL
ncbi:MAG: tripartite tricarboxylate transporter TctB family protein [Spirochaetes bacterium]|nr:tripartite tricarboxylate transporter TctB family protein [Spirochaetota bacterium]